MTFSFQIHEIEILHGYVHDDIEFIVTLFYPIITSTILLELVSNRQKTPGQ